jgi:hypothetical protein
MKMIAAAIAVLSLAGTAHALEPIDGSITYKDPDVRMGFSRVPVGSTFEHHFYDNGGDHIVETYRVNPDRTLRLIFRVHREHG